MSKEESESPPNDDTEIDTTQKRNPKIKSKRKHKDNKTEVEREGEKEKEGEREANEVEVGVGEGVKVEMEIEVEFLQAVANEEELRRLDELNSRRACLISLAKMNTFNTVSLLSRHDPLLITPPGRLASVTRPSLTPTFPSTSHSSSSSTSISSKSVSVFASTGLSSHFLKAAMYPNTLTGESFTPAALAMSDVWGRNAIGDVVKMIQPQKKRQFEIERKELLRKSGLGLLESSGNTAFFFKERDHVYSSHGIKSMTSTNNASDNTNNNNNNSHVNPCHELLGHHQKKHQREMEAQMSMGVKVLRVVPELKGLHKLKFVKMKRLKELAQFQFPPNNSNTNNITNNSSTNTNTNNNNNNNNKRDSTYKYDKINVQEQDQDIEGQREKSTDSLQLPYRPITHLSTRTNMRFMLVGNSGVIALSEALIGDRVVTHLCLSTAHISLSGITALSGALPDIHSLLYLDLSHNAIEDSGAMILASTIRFAAIPKPLPSSSSSSSSSNSTSLSSAHSLSLSHTIVLAPKHPLQRLVLAGNRITDVGAEALVSAVLFGGSHIRFLR